MLILWQRDLKYESIKERNVVLFIELNKIHHLNKTQQSKKKIVYTTKKINFSTFSTDITSSYTDLICGKTAVVTALCKSTPTAGKQDQGNSSRLILSGLYCNTILSSTSTFRLYRACWMWFVGRNRYFLHDVTPRVVIASNSWYTNMVQWLCLILEFGLTRI